MMPQCLPEFPMLEYKYLSQEQADKLNKEITNAKW